MSRDLTTDQQTASLAPYRVNVLLLAAFFGSGPLKFALCPYPIPGGYLATGALLSVDPMPEAMDGSEGIAFTLAGIDPAIVDIAANEEYRGRIIQILKARLDPETHDLIGSPTIEWIGRMHNMIMRPSNSKFDISVVAEHYEIDLARPLPRRYTDSDQQRQHPGDKGCEYVSAMTERYVPFPSRQALVKDEERERQRRAREKNEEYRDLHNNPRGR